MVAAIVESVEVVALPVANGTRAAGEVVVAVLAAGAARRKVRAVTSEQRGRDALATANAPEGMHVRARVRGATEHVLMRWCVGAWVRAPSGEYGGVPSPVCQPGVYALSKSKTIEPGVIGGIGGDGGGNGGGSAAPGATGEAQIVKPFLHAPSSDRIPSAKARQWGACGGSSVKCDGRSSTSRRCERDATFAQNGQSAT